MKSINHLNIYLINSVIDQANWPLKFDEKELVTFSKSEYPHASAIYLPNIFQT